MSALLTDLNFASRAPDTSIPCNATCAAVHCRDILEQWKNELGAVYVQSLFVI